MQPEETLPILPSVLEVPAPKFDQYQLVVLYWNGQEHTTRIVKRYYDPDENTWSYQVYGMEGLYPADLILGHIDGLLRPNIY